MGPSIKSCCYEISDDLIKLFDNSFINIKGNRSFLDLNKCIISDFKEIGIRKIKVDKTCTYENKNCNSYRRDKSSSNRMYSLITYKKCNI